jgi:hypothetical protein
MDEVSACVQLHGLRIAEREELLREGTRTETRVKCTVATINWGGLLEEHTRGTKEIRGATG